jgi:hypothetical protein
MPRFKFKVGDVLSDPITKEQVIIKGFYQIKSGAALKSTWFVSLLYKSDYGEYSYDRPYKYIKTNYELNTEYRVKKEVTEWLKE